MGLFREYDLRGIVGQELTESIAEQVGRAYCTYVKNRGVKRISVGRDGRLSSPGLHKALVRGLLAGGLDVVDIGICPSPLVYFSLFQLSVDGGIMITGSHNAAEYNGFKICIGKEAIHGEEKREGRKENVLRSANSALSAFQKLIDGRSCNTPGRADFLSLKVARFESLQHIGLGNSQSLRGFSGAEQTGHC